ncbi:unnamed protein product [Tenebrio molitor]|nr:unnamed protein product [Tenebrio molitor]
MSTKSWGCSVPCPRSLRSARDAAFDTANSDDQNVSSKDDLFRDYFFFCPYFCSRWRMILVRKTKDFGGVESPL